MATTATSTLILAIEARNQTQAAFGQIRADMQGQVTAAREAAAQQLQVVREGLAQQVLAQRQALEQQVAAIRAGGGTNVDAQVLAARQAYEQQALAAKESAEQQALAIKAGLAQQVDAQKVASAEQIATVRAQAAEAAAALRSEASVAPRAGVGGFVERIPVVGAPLAEAGEGLAGGVERLRGAFGTLLSPLTSVLGPLDHFVGMGLQMTGWLVGYQILGELSMGVGRLASGLISANASLEQYNMTLQAIYGSSQRAAQASTWVDQFAEKTPFTREETRQAALTIASLGDNVAQVLPAVGNLSSIMGVDLPRGAQAFADAQQGRFEMLMMTLRTSKEELVTYGLQLDSSGHVMNNSFVPAFEKFVAARYPTAMALQMQTFTGALSNVQDALQFLQRTMGQPLFEVLKTQLAGLFVFLNRPDVEAWAARAGAAIGQAAAGIIAWVGRLLPSFLQLAPIIGGALSRVGDAIGLLGALFAGALPYIVGVAQAMANAWRGASPLVGQAIGVIMGVAQAMGTFIHDRVFPVIKEALDRAAQWWRDHGDNVARIVSAIVTVVLAFIGTLGTNMQAGFDVLHGIWLAGWGLLSGVVGLAIDAMTGNWTSFGKDLSDMSTQIAAGVVYIFEGLVIKVIAIIGALKDPINALMHGMYQFSTAVGTLIAGVFDNVRGYIARLFNDLVSGLANILGGLATGPVGKLLAALDPAKANLLRAAAGVVAQIPAFGTGSLGDLVTALKGKISLDLVPDSGATAAQIAHEKAMLAWVEAAYKHGDSLQTFIQGLTARVGIDTAAGRAVSPGQLALEKDLLARAQALAAGKAAALPPFALGLPPGVDITWGVDPSKAIQDATDRANQIIADIQGKPNPFTGIVTHVGDQTLADTRGGKGFWDALLADLKNLKAQGISLPPVTLKDLFKLPAVDLTPPGGGDLFDPRSAAAALKAARTEADRRLAEARARLDLYVESGRATVGGGLERVRAVMAAERALPASERPGPAQMALEAFNLTRGLYEKVLAHMQKQLDVDVKNHADHTKLLQEEASYLKILAREPGVTSTDVAAAKQALDAAIGVTTAGVPRAPIAPVPRYGALAGETGYGQTTVSFGGAQATPWPAMVAALREQITHLRAQLAKDDQLIALLEVGNATDGQQLTALRSIDGHVTPGPPHLPRSAHSVLKAAGSYAPVTR